jgi:3-phosphoshikimate 1-carboxyvinyltransferase
MVARCIESANGPIDATFDAMPSKSATHRALIAGALAFGRSEIRGPLDAEDTRRTLHGLRSLGIAVDEADRAWVVHGHGVIPGGGVLSLGASGTSARFLLALASLGGSPSVLDGSPRLRERPMDELIVALRSLGASVTTSGQTLWPLRAGGSMVMGGSVVLSGEKSSQFASALLLVASSFERGLRLTVAPPRVSFAYVRLTLETLTAFGAVVTSEGDGRFSVPPQRLRAATVAIEGDHSSASYLFAAAAILGGRVRVRGLRPDSAQPDARFLEALRSLGCRVGADANGVLVESSGRVPAFSWDLGDAPDLAPTAAVLALFAEGPCVLSGLQHLTLKESDRLAALEHNLVRLGARVDVREGALSIVPPSPPGPSGAPIRAMNDHRIAMAFAIAGLRIPGTTIDDSEAVAKSYPRFWKDFAGLARTGS